MPTLIHLHPLTIPIPTIAPIRNWVIDTGTPKQKKKWAVIASVKTADKNEKETKLIMKLPTVQMTLSLNEIIPINIKIPPNKAD